MDVEKLRQLVRHYRFYASISGNGSSPCTVQQVNDVVAQTAKLLERFLDELESN